MCDDPFLAGLDTPGGLVAATAARVFPHPFRDELWDIAPEAAATPNGPVMQQWATQQQACAQHQAMGRVVHILWASRTIARVSDHDLSVAIGALWDTSGRERRALRAAIRSDWRRVVLAALSLPVSPWPYVPGVLAALDGQARRRRAARYLEHLKEIRVEEGPRG